VADEFLQKRLYL